MQNTAIVPLGVETGPRRAGDPAVPAAGSARIRREPGGRRAAGTWRLSSARPGQSGKACRSPGDLDVLSSFG
ncbi:MAG: hypothetical protein AB1327_04035 [Bacillota bacterium]